MSVAAGATALVVDILTNTSQLGTGLAQAEAQITTSANRMGKQMETAGGGMAEGILRSFVPKLTLALGVTVADKLTGALKDAMAKSTLAGDWIEQALMTGGSYIPVVGHVADILRPYGEEAGLSWSEAFWEGVTKYTSERGGFGQILFRSDRFHEGTEFGLMDWLGAQFQAIFDPAYMDRIRPMQPFGVPKNPNEDLIRERQFEFARLTAEQQILNQEDVRSQWVQRRIQIGIGQVSTALGAFKSPFGDPGEASKRVYEAAMKQVVSLDRIKAILEEIGPNVNGRN